jgi:hypothetical protein
VVSATVPPQSFNFGDITLHDTKTEQIKLNKPDTALVEKWPLSSTVFITVAYDECILPDIHGITGEL